MSRAVPVPLAPALGVVAVLVVFLTDAPSQDPSLVGIQAQPVDDGEAGVPLDGLQRPIRDAVEEAIRNVNAGHSSATMPESLIDTYHESFRRAYAEHMMEDYRGVAVVAHETGVYELMLVTHP